MSEAQLVSAAEEYLRNAEANIAGCAASLEQAVAANGRVPNAEVIALAHAQAAIAQGYATLALAKGGAE